MRVSVLVHGLLLIVALLVGYRTWTKEEVKDKSSGTYTVWDKPKNAFESLEYETDLYTMAIEYRNDGGERYLWGEIRRTAKNEPAKPPTPPEGEEGEPPVEKPAPPPAATRTNPFPIGESGETLVTELSSLKALRDLGKLTDEQKKLWELDKETNHRLAVFFAGEKDPRELRFGGRVVGGSDVYAIDPKTGNGYVIASKLANALTGGESALSLRKYHKFETSEVGIITVKTKAGEKTLIKGEAEGESGKKETWAYKEKVGTPDLTLSNFLDRIGRLTPREYNGDLDKSKLTWVGTLTYKSAQGRQLGVLELYVDEKPQQLPNQPPVAPDEANGIYYMRTEATRVLGKVTRPTAERTHQDLAEIFGATEPPEAPKVAPPPEPPMPPHGAPPMPPGHGGHGAHDPHGMPGAPPPAAKPAKPAARPATPVKPAAPKSDKKDAPQPAH